MEESIEEIPGEFRKHLQTDGGDIELIGIDEGIVKVRLSRTTVPVTFSTFLRDYKTREGIRCGSCRIPTGTIIDALEITLKQKIPSVAGVEQVK
ncbi:MAG: hypothetical protein GWP12_00035 [Nitrospirae bacterium]|nr:hypothetical protein [Nitrospirota bacterium]